MTKHVLAARYHTPGDAAESARSRERGSSPLRPPRQRPLEPSRRLDWDDDHSSSDLRAELAQNPMDIVEARLGNRRIADLVHGVYV